MTTTDMPNKKEIKKELDERSSPLKKKIIMTRKRYYWVLSFLMPLMPILIIRTHPLIVNTMTDVLLLHRPDGVHRPGSLRPRQGGDREDRWREEDHWKDSSLPIKCPSIVRSS
ncbi:unnamed protein product [Nezara viridula]|uniref:Uncharacterized protein n=1 Tax=Nezara viridula TaxID=85310 RepID=A0A9P0MQQ8_NEZVI|nr:unnamed protein product [Nezara viridula]